MLTPRLLQLPADKITGLDTFDQLPVVIAHGGEARALGKGLTTGQRQRSALGEWLERSILYDSMPQRYASVRELGANCLPPPLFGLDLPAEQPDLVVQYDEDRRVGWTPVRSLSGERRWMHQPGWREMGFHRPTSNGAAVGDREQDTLNSAVAELLERHAFVAWWYGLATASPISATSPAWKALAEWFADQEWQLTAHLLLVTVPLPTVLAAAIRHGEAAVIGLGTGAGSENPIESAAVGAALEIVQALESFALLRGADQPIEGDLVQFLTPAGEAAIRSRLWPIQQAPRNDAHWISCPVSAARQAGIEIWNTSRTVGPRTHFVQAFSPDTLPFPSTGRGRRLDHPILWQRLAASNRNVASVPGLPHPLG